MSFSAAAPGEDLDGGQQPLRSLDGVTMNCLVVTSEALSLSRLQLRVRPRLPRGSDMPKLPLTLPAGRQGGPSPARTPARSIAPCHSTAHLRWRLAQGWHDLGVTPPLADQRSDVAFQPGYFSFEHTVFGKKHPNCLLSILLVACSCSGSWQRLIRDVYSHTEKSFPKAEMHMNIYNAPLYNRYMCRCTAENITVHKAMRYVVFLTFSPTHCLLIHFP